jgi:hypothetical protein
MDKQPLEFGSSRNRHKCNCLVVGGRFVREVTGALGPTAGDLVVVQEMLMRTSIITELRQLLLLLALTTIAVVGFFLVSGTDNFLAEPPHRRLFWTSLFEIG